ncbi:MAG: hypothetical protein CVV30_00015 [Methanomicrobiales archaeon HGW-Methanomicrobiales-1]|jgi:hypothetical protein|nr:MAG: hypothetical protein CVV30_00015 [Methanomicrobiales archaeon HGW-Methanomicrobiales-1]
MTRISEIAEHWWLGLCPKAPVVRASQAGIGDPFEPAHEGRPDGGAGRPGTIRRGIGAALSGTKTLAQNRQLLWFTLLAGLVLGGNAIGQAALRYIGRTLQPDIIVHYALDFLLGFATLFCLVFLLAGLFLSISLKKEGSASFLEGLYRAKKYLKSIFLWSLVLVLAAMLLIYIWSHFFYWLPPELRFLNILGPFQFIASTITQFPFNWTLDWDMLTEIPGYGGRSLLLWIYPFGFMETLQFSAITLLLFILTPFVVPLVVLEQKTLWEAVMGSFAMMKKIWAEVAACALFLGVIVSAVFLMYLLVQAVSGIVSPYQTITFHPPGSWIVLALLYNLALLTVVFVVATIGGIAAQHLYTSAKNRNITESPEPHS